jgi:two-component system, OmpR family, sensor histidine kinase MprB
MTFRTRLVLAATTAAVLAVLVASAGSYLAARNSLLNSVDASLQLTAQHSLENGGLDPALLTGLAVQIVAPNGEVVARGGELPGSRALPVSPSVVAVASGQTSQFVTVQVGGTALREYVTHLPGPVVVEGIPLATGGALQLASPLTGVDQQLGNLGLALTLVAIAAVLLAMFLGWSVARAAVNPLNSLTARLESLAQNPDVSERLDAGGADELGRLRRAFNRLLGAVESSREAQRQLVLDAAHELRTPLTSLRTNLEVVRRLDELSPADRTLLVDDVLTQLQELTHLVSDLAELARGERPPEEVVPLRLDQLTEDAVAVAQTHARSKGVRFTLRTEPVWVLGSPERLARAVGNLLDNALKWSPNGGMVEVTCEGGSVTIRDHGPGIDPADLEHIFNRFYRAPAARGLPGSGLGLAIVAQVADAEQGDVTAENAPGGGALFTLTLPEIPDLSDTDAPLDRWAPVEDWAPPRDALLDDSGQAALGPPAPPFANGAGVPPPRANGMSGSAPSSSERAAHHDAGWPVPAEDLAPADDSTPADS